MESFDQLLETIEALLGSKGCPWSQKQTLETLQPYLIEEVYEFFEALEEVNFNAIMEELGDLFFLLLFFAKVLEKQKNLPLKKILSSIREKLLRRHPHVFSDLKMEKIEEIEKNWERIKKEEKKEERKSLLDGIPKHLPPLLRAQKVLQKIKKTSYQLQFDSKMFLSQSQVEENLFSLLLQCEKSRINATLALKNAIKKLELQFRIWEEKTLIES